MDELGGGSLFDWKDIVNIGRAWCLYNRDVSHLHGAVGDSSNVGGDFGVSGNGDDLGDVTDA